MRIVIDLQGAQTASRWRGIGKYSMALTQAIARNPGRHEIWLALNGNFPEAVLDIRKTFQDLIPRERIHVFRMPLSAGEEHTSHQGFTRAAEKIREYSLDLLKPDVVLLTSLFEGFSDQAVTSIGALPTAAKTAVILYDLIPMLDPDAYHDTQSYRDHYQRKIRWLREADLLLAISENTRNEAIEHLALKNLKIDTISPPVDERFRPLSISNETAAGIRRGYGIDRKIILCASGSIDSRKNLGRLITAYSRLTMELRSEYQLVITGMADPYLSGELERQSGEVGLAKNELVLTGYVDDDDMPALYNMAVLSVFPSLSEGLGLPVLESMACGTPVIASDIPSITKIMGYPEAQFDPRSTESIRECLDRHLQNESLRSSLRDHGLKQVADNSWGKCAREIIDSLENLACCRDSEPAESTIPSPEMEDLLSSIADIENLPAHDKALRLISHSIAGSTTAENTGRQLLVDISTIYFTDIKTGIQRVVRAQLLELLKNPPEGFSVEPVYLGQVNNRWIYRHADSYLGQLLGIGKLCLPNRPADIHQGDILYIPDYAPGPFSLAAEDGLYLKIKAAGVSINTILYDLLPILKPEYFNSATVIYHKRMLEVFARFADQVICISGAVAAELSAWLRKEAPEKSGRLIINSLHLGADIESSAPSFSSRGEDTLFPEKRSSVPTFLMVGTVEPRKGHLQALAAFDLLWQMHKDVRLLVVGREGWLQLPPGERKTISSIVTAIREHPELNNRLFWENDADDTRLMDAYDSSTCLLSPSEGEGFGLPLIEAARHDLPILARDIPVFREVAGDHALYFSGLEPESLAEAVSAWLELYEEGKHPSSSGIEWLTWEENVEKLKAILMSAR